MSGDEVVDRLRQYTTSVNNNNNFSNNNNNNNKRKRPIKRYRKRPRVVADDVIGYYMDQKRRYYSSIRNNNNNSNKEPRKLSLGYSSSSSNNNNLNDWTPTEEHNKKGVDSNPFQKFKKQDTNISNNKSSSNNKSTFVKKQSNVNPFQSTNNVLNEEENVIDKEEKLWKPAQQSVKPKNSHKKNKKHRNKAEEVEKRIPENIKRIVKDSGSRIINRVLHTTTKRQGFGSNGQLGLGDKLRTMFYGSVYPAFAPEHVTAHLVAQWVNVLAITFAWLALGGMYSTASIGGGRSFDNGYNDDDQDDDEVWQDLIPDSRQVADILREVASAADRWGLHDEL